MPKASAFASAAGAIGDAAARWCDADFPPRVRAQTRIVERTGYSLPVVEYALDRLFESITADAILQTIEREIGDRDVEPVGSVAILSSRTTIGVAVVPAIFAIVAGNSVLVKDREDHFVREFFETLAEELAASRRQASFAAEAWESGREQHDLSAFDAVVVFGSEETLRAVRARLRPGARFIGYGPKASIGYVAREALVDEASAERIAEGAARDFLLYDGEGCLSLHALFVERGGAVTPERFMELLARAAEAAEVEFPLGGRRAEVAARVAAARDLAIFRGEPHFTSSRATFAVLAGNASRAPGFLPRVVDVHAVDSRAETRAYVERHHLPIELCAGENGVAFGEMQNPPLAYAHGGRPRFAEFVR